MQRDVPTAGIVLWSGAIGDIPTGFQLCDGTNGTPDLRDKFVVAGGDTYDPTDTGGAATHDHDFTGDGHDHYLESGAEIPEGLPHHELTSSENITGTTNAGNTLAPYYALCYIMETR